MLVLVYIPEYLPNKLKELKKIYIYKIFKNHGLRITIAPKLPKVSFYIIK